MMVQPQQSKLLSRKRKNGIDWKKFKSCYLYLTCRSSLRHAPSFPIVQNLESEPFQHETHKKHIIHATKSLALELNMLNQQGFDCDTPTMSKKEDISWIWRELHGSRNWEGLLEPLNPLLRREIVKYGEFSQATYDSFDFDSYSKCCGSNRYKKDELFDKLHLTRHGYKVTRYIYAMSDIDLPRWLERSLVDSPWSKESNWMGFVAVSTDDESNRLGRRDIVVAWRGTVATSEWIQDLNAKLKHLGQGNVKVEKGFLSIYTTRSGSSKYNKKSASQQVMKELTKLVSLYKEKGEKVSLTITGHSLGGALALLNAHEAATTLAKDVTVSAITFAGPRVGNIAFRDELNKMGVKVLRVVNEPDVIPKVPGLGLMEILEKKYDSIARKIEWAYIHVGVELRVDISASPFIKQEFDLGGFHSLEIYLHLIDGYYSKNSKFRSHARRDIALINKGSDMLIDKWRIPKNWHQVSNKGLVYNQYGRWIQPPREQEDLPSPAFSDHSSSSDESSSEGCMKISIID